MKSTKIDLKKNHKKRKEKKKKKKAKHCGLPL